jgi:ABC-type amino acid transport substrate-binding protein
LESGDVRVLTARCFARSQTVITAAVGTADRLNNMVMRVSADGVLRVAVNASLFSPFGVAVDGQVNVFIADTLNHRIRKVARIRDLRHTAARP